MLPDTFARLLYWCFSFVRWWGESYSHHVAGRVRDHNRGRIRQSQGAQCGWAGCGCGRQGALPVFGAGPARCSPVQGRHGDKHHPTGGFCSPSYPPRGPPTPLPTPPAHVKITRLACCCRVGPTSPEDLCSALPECGNFLAAHLHAASSCGCQHQSCPITTLTCEDSKCLSHSGRRHFATPEQQGRLHIGLPRQTPLWKKSCVCVRNKLPWQASLWQNTRKLCTGYSFNRTQLYPIVTKASLRLHIILHAPSIGARYFRASLQTGVGAHL